MGINFMTFFSRIFLTFEFFYQLFRKTFGASFLDSIFLKSWHLCFIRYLDTFLPSASPLAAPPSAPLPGASPNTPSQ